MSEEEIPITIEVNENEVGEGLRFWFIVGIIMVVAGLFLWAISGNNTDFFDAVSFILLLTFPINAHTFIKGFLNHRKMDNAFNRYIIVHSIVMLLLCVYFLFPDLSFWFT